MADDSEQTLFTGSNVENSSYGGTLCGERTAIFTAVSAGYRRLRYIAVSTIDSLDGPLSDRSPCGPCRQVIREFASGEGDSPSLILIDSGRDDVLCEVFDIDRLLPYGFNFAPPAS